MLCCQIIILYQQGSIYALDTRGIFHTDVGGTTHDNATDTRVILAIKNCEGYPESL